MIFQIVLIAAGVVGIIFCVYMWIRNNCVCDYRTNVLWNSSHNQQQCLDNLHKLPSYDAMLWQLCTFNWDKYWK